MSIDPVTGGGTAERTVKISQHLARSGVETSLLTSDIGVDEKLRNSLSDVKLHIVKNVYSRYYISRFTVKRIAKVVAQAGVIHLMGHWVFLNALIYLIAKILRKPYVVCPAGALPIYGRSKNLKKFYNFIIGQRIIRDADGHVAIAANEISQFQAYGINSNRVSLIPNGVNAEDFHSTDAAAFRRKYVLKNHPFIMFMGRLNDIKGPDLVLQAFCNLKNELKGYHLVFAGPDGGMLAKLKAKVEEFKINDRVHFLGYLGGVDKSQAFYAADLLAIPSRQEAMSIVAIEAGITGTPVLLTDQCGFDEIVRVGGGQVVTASVSGLQKGLVEILSNPKQLELMGSNLKKHVIDNYTWDKIINKYIKLYEEVLSKISS
jgi:glycosyltransferase involved in cell wall biosynthesis